jgi:hypothetical protein
MGSDSSINLLGGGVKIYGGMKTIMTKLSK